MKRNRSALAVLVILIVCMLAVLAGCGKKEYSAADIKGKWKIDDAVSFYFDGNDRGSVTMTEFDQNNAVTGENEEKFTYKIEKNVLSFDYDSDGQENSEYELEFDGGVLILNATGDQKGNVYRLEPIK